MWPFFFIVFFSPSLFLLCLLKQKCSIFLFYSLALGWTVHFYTEYWNIVSLFHLYDSNFSDLTTTRGQCYVIRLSSGRFFVSLFSLVIQLFKTDRRKMHRFAEPLIKYTQKKFEVCSIKKVFET